MILAALVLAGQIASAQPVVSVAGNAVHSSSFLHDQIVLALKSRSYQDVQHPELQIDRCILSVTDSRDGSHVCAIRRSDGAAALLRLDATEKNAAPGSCIVSAINPRDGASLCAARKR